MFSHAFGLRQAEPGDCSGEAIPVPIPNTEVKLSSAENTEGAAPRQDRSSPGSLASWGRFASRADGAPKRTGHGSVRVGYPHAVNDTQLTPCPWLLDGTGSIQPGRPRHPSRCGADAARPELSHQVRERRCLVGAECEIRAAREAALGSLAATSHHINRSATHSSTQMISLRRLHHLAPGLASWRLPHSLRCSSSARSSDHCTRPSRPVDHRKR